MQTQAAFEFCQRPVRAKAPARLVFALMPDEASAHVLADIADRFCVANDLEAAPLRPVIALHRLAATKAPVLYGAKLAGQAVAAAGLTVTFDTIATVDGRLLALTGSDKTLAGVHQALAAAIAHQGLRAEDTAPVLALAQAGARVPPQAVKPVKIRVSGLALLRGAPDDFQVLRRWPLNRAITVR